VKELPESVDSLVIRTDFSDDAAWQRICREVDAGDGEFFAYVAYVNDREYEGIGIEDLTALGRRGPWRGFLFAVDHETVANPEHPILVVDLVHEPGRSFRAIPHEMPGIENNLSIANMDFVDFAESVDADGVFRGFPEG